MTRTTCDGCGTVLWHSKGTRRAIVFDPELAKHTVDACPLCYNKALALFANNIPTETDAGNAGERPARDRWESRQMCVPDSRHCHGDLPHAHGAGEGRDSQRQLDHPAETMPIKTHSGIPAPLSERSEQGCIA